MGFAINKKIADKKTASSAKTNVQAGGSSKFIAKASTKSSGASKKPIKTGGSRGSWCIMDLNRPNSGLKKGNSMNFPFLMPKNRKLLN